LGLGNSSLASKNYSIIPSRKIRGGLGIIFKSELMPFIMDTWMMMIIYWRKLSGSWRRRCELEC